MRDYGKVHVSFWSSDTLKGVGDDGRFLALYLLTCGHGNMAGVFRLPMGYAIEDTGWVSERLSNGFKTLSDAGWLKRDERTGWTFIVNWPKWNRPDNPNQRKAVEKMVDQVPDSVGFKDSIVSAWGFSETVSEPLGNPPYTSPSPSLSPELPKIGLQDGTDYAVPAELLADLKAAFPKVDIPAELAKARAWCAANPAERKTRRGIGRFLNGWMGRAKPVVEPELPKPGGGRRAL